MKKELYSLIGELKKTAYYYAEIDIMPILDNDAIKYLLGKNAMEDKILSQIKDLNELVQYINDCTRCKLYKNRQNIVFGEGNPKADLVFIGEAPGREEDIAGKPFVGEAGRLLTKIIQAMGLDRKDVYICNVVKCRPPRNRDPEQDEIKACLPFLEVQLRIIKPQVICTLGKIAAQTLLGADFKITKHRGNWYSYMNISVMPTFHPAYLLRNPSAKRFVWDDIKKVMEKLSLDVKKNP